LSVISVDSVQNTRRSIKHDHLDVTNLRRPDLLSEYSKLEDKYHKLRSQFADSVDVIERLQEQCREKAKAYENWRQHANTLEGQVTARNKKIEKLKSRLADVALNDAAANSSFASDTYSVTGDGRGTSEARPGGTKPQVTNAPTLWPPVMPNDTPDRDSSIPDTERAPSLPPLPRLHGTETQRSPIKQEPSSDAPVIIGERVILKRRRDNDPSARTPAATRVKTESGSDPIFTEEQHRFIPHESIDFDTAEETVPTPRKNKDKHPAPGGVSPYMREHSPSVFLEQDSMSAHVQERGQDAMHHREEAMREQEMQVADYGDPPGRSSALYPLSVNTPVRKAIARKPKSQAVVTSSALRRGIASLAEDNDDEHGSSSLSVTHGSGKTSRLNTLLNTTVASMESIALPTGVRLESVPATHAFHIAMPPRRELTFGKQGQNRVGEALIAPETPILSNSKRTPSAIKPKQKVLHVPTKESKKPSIPLRERPKWSLHREDFKVNPKHNDGFDYAFTDVVRNKSDRACLSGCTKETCCGKYFRPQAHIDRETTGDLEFEALLVDYLGAELWRLDTMTTDEKEKMWIDAKIRQLANKYGKHRVRYERMASPPGYWRADFPSTQENIEDNEEAKRMELEVVEDRHREAVKKGRWLFRDEEP
jgi:hypothetical protein